MKVRRGDIVFLYESKYLGQIGNYQGGVRPLLVVSNDKGNHFSNVCIVCPLTAKHKRLDLPTHIKIGHHNSITVCEQLFTINQDDIFQIVNHISDSDMERVNEALKISLDLG